LYNYRFTRRLHALEIYTADSVIISHVR